VQRYAARALVLADGRLLFDGTPGEFLAEAGRDLDGDFEDAFVSFLRARGQR
jgi:ABC-type phosphate/phosphonate transport system ATPase subunit